MAPAIYMSMGPSGAGKDTLLLGARDALKKSGDLRVEFVPRRITRAAAEVTDLEDPVSVAQFDAAEAAGEHALSWVAHSTKYAIPKAALDAALARGSRCVLNVSRTVIDEARSYGAARGAEVYALYITVPDNELRRRLLSRGREDAAAIDGRLARSRAILPTGSHVLTIPNEGTVAEGVELVRRALLGDEPVMAAARQRTIDASRPAPAAGWESTRVRVIAVAASVLCAALIIGRLSRATSRASS